MPLTTQGDTKIPSGHIKQKFNWLFWFDSLEDVCNDKARKVFVVVTAFRGTPVCNFGGVCPLFKDAS